MNLISKQKIKKLLSKKSVRPLKKFGQNFLISKQIFKKIIAAAELSSKDIVLEIGPGVGNLTQILAQKTKKVIAIEKDKKMVEILKETLKEFKNIEIIQGDILKIDPKNYLPAIAWSDSDWQAGNLKSKNYKVVANLPYYIVSPVIRKFLELIEVNPQSMVLMVQKEVAQRICAKPPKMNLLAVSVQFYSEPKIISYVSKKYFWPQPKVDSAIIKLKVKKQNLKINKDLFFKIVKAGFSHPRKQLINNLSQGLKIDREKTRKWLLKNKINPIKRAEALSIKDWLKLTKTFTFKF